MGNLSSYLNWRGDLTFDDAPFNVLDSLVFCQLSYLDMHEVLGDGQGAERMTFREIVERLSAGSGLSILLADGIEKHDEYADFVRLAAGTRRFQDVLLYGYRDITDKTADIQFSAVTFRIDARTDYIAFRGTDDSIVGWKEDFLIACEKIPAQDAALAYVQEVLLRDPDRRFYIGGHSKGANLALYAAALLPEYLSSRVLHVYVNDGPGLCSDVLDTSVIRGIDHKTTKIVPEYDVIGKIFEMPVTDNRIVKSTGTGIMQHGILTWILKDGDLDTVPENAPGSRWIGTVLDNWIGSVAPPDRRTFIDDLFDTMAAGGTDTFYELKELGPEGLEKMIAKAAHVSPVTWDVAVTLPLTAAVGPKQAKKTKDRFQWFVDLIKTNSTARALILMAGGTACMLIPESLLPLTIAVAMLLAVIGILAYTFHTFRQSHWDLAAIRTQGYLSIISVVVFLMLIVKEGALMLISNMVYGILFLSLAYHILQRAHTLERKSPRWYGSLAEAGILILMALFILTAPMGTIRYFTFSCGAIFVLDGLIHLVSGLRRKRAGVQA